MRNDLDRNRFVRLMADYFTTGIWDLNGKSTDPSFLSDNIELVERVKAWQASFDKTDPFSGLTQEENSQHMEEGLEIAKMVKEEHPKWNVVLSHKGYFKGNMDRKGNLIIDDSLMTA